ncbi:HemK2/MTQ2 family protein methyltransferase [Mycolicibacterium smegmatis]|jgi:release factor glutamine methyltransferase|uniref:Methylase, putative n=1 Tax=Mycolicibacterium smegmatis (strain MKD8) TaxID=1214915 RepID=A0A2U9PLY1_MYCSE|nr:HemK2/MTQ2 family protein methyltransferase [Mycolicibacterium smegmatis]AWT52751.1 methylase, putative [Mycolicibacterium smegmatis MKD8]MCP2623372.1 class I SAM-dependent methyltransferase [Mycolicibacterium smegmatis]MDF1902914.1 class I SAM-dependent methyltransferase [Mycolicibacterium smegmatis]MDF1909189.1 class I SAM-dependent methyltransferase [Mycolicibacterium smegmatis]MDF1921368.1 class I SAM-dependent methyltransferase [Mycolicibacterium smegmatis]
MLAIAAEGVYRPQEDSQLLIDALERSGEVPGRRVLDLCTGSGVVAIAAAHLGAEHVTALDICPRAVEYATANAAAAAADVDVKLGTWNEALNWEPFDLVVCNPPYVPTSPAVDPGSVAPWAGPATAWDGGADGRMILDPLCDVAGAMLAEGGSLFLVQSEFSGVEESLTRLSWSGLKTEVVVTQSIPWGPVVTAQAEWLRETGRLHDGRDDEVLVVIRADKP